MAYRIEYMESVADQFKAVTARNRATLLDRIHEQLAREPLVETRNRKPLRPNPIAPWELRVGNYRVFYDVVEGEEPKVLILALGEKQGNTLRIAGKEISL